MSKPKLVILYPNQFGYHTDTYKYCEHLRESFEITYFCFDQGFKRISLQNIDVVYLAYNKGKIKRLAHLYKQVIIYTCEVHTDIIFTVQFKFCFLIGLFAKAKVKILDYRTSDLNSNSIIRWLKNVWLWSDSLFFGSVTVISEGCRDILFLNKKRTFILPLGGDILSIKPHSYSQITMLYVGSFHLRNIHQTIEGVALFITKNKEYSSMLSYNIIGFGKNNDEEKIKNAIRQNGLTEIVTYVGRVNYQDLPNWFDYCNIGVSYVPKTQGYEFQPVTKTFEYVNSGLFTIATSTFENKKMITPQNGVLCDDTPESFAEALEQVFRIKDSIREAEVRESMREYQWGKIIDNILKPYLLRLLEGNA